MMKIIGIFFLLVGVISSQSAFAVSAAVNDAGTTYEFNREVEQDADLVLIGVYEANSSHGGGSHPMFPATVTIEDGGNKPLVLVLSSYEPVLWNIEVASGVQIQEVILNGYHNHDFTGVDAALVTDKSGVGNYFEACGYRYPYNGGGCNTDELITDVEVYTGLSLNAFAGAYNASDFSVVTSAGAEVEEPKDPYSYVAITSISDINGNGYSEIAALRWNPVKEKTEVHIKDGHTNKTIRKIRFFNHNFTPKDLAVVPDMNGNGTPEIVVMAIHNDTGVVRSKIKDTFTKEKLGKVRFPKTPK